MTWQIWSIPCTIVPQPGKVVRCYIKAWAQTVPFCSSGPPERTVEIILYIVRFSEYFQSDDVIMVYLFQVHAHGHEHD